MTTGRIHYLYVNLPGKVSGDDGSLSAPWGEVKVIKSWRVLGQSQSSVSPRGESAQPNCWSRNISREVIRARTRPAVDRAGLSCERFRPFQAGNHESGRLSSEERRIGWCFFTNFIAVKWITRSPGIKFIFKTLLADKTSDEIDSIEFHLRPTLDKYVCGPSSQQQWMAPIALNNMTQWIYVYIYVDAWILRLSTNCGISLLVVCHFPASHDRSIVNLWLYHLSDTPTNNSFPLCYNKSSWVVGRYLPP